MIIADEGAAYTQSCIEIKDADGNRIAYRPWRDNWKSNYDPEGNPLADNPIEFGDSGYYGDWVMED